MSNLENQENQETPRSEGWPLDFDSVESNNFDEDDDNIKDNGFQWKI